MLDALVVAIYVLAIVTAVVAARTFVQTRQRFYDEYRNRKRPLPR
jgi:hypothetical protein